MSVGIDFSAESKVLTIIMDGDFDSSKLEDFKQAYESDQYAPIVYVLDMDKIRYMDSTALGMLLALREHAQSKHADVRIINMNDVVLEIFRVLNFHKLFKPEYNKTSYKVDWVAHHTD